MIYPATFSLDTAFGEYYLVVIAKNCDQMYAIHASLPNKYNKLRLYDWDALFIDNADKQDLCNGVLLFWQKVAADPSIVTHELTHAAVHMFRMYGPKLWEKMLNSVRNEEIHAYIMGEFTKQYWRKYRRLTNDGSVRGRHRNRLSVDAL